MATLEIDLSIRGLNESVRGFSTLSSSIEENVNLQKQLADRLKDVSTKLKAGSGDYNQLKQRQLELRAASTQLNRELSNQVKTINSSDGSLVQMRARLSNLRTAYDNLSAAQRNSSLVQRTLVKDIQNLNREISKAEQQTGRFQRNVGNYGGALGGGLSALSPQLSQLVGKGGGLIGLSLAAKNAFDTVSSFDSGLKNVQKTTGLTSQETSKLGDEFIRLSKELKTVSTQSLTEYATVAGQLGVKGTQNILAFTEALAKLETASDITGEQGGAEIARLLTLTDGGVQNVKRFGDEIVNLGNNFAATESEILGNATRIAQSTGVYKLGRENVLAYATATKSIGVEAELVGSTIGRTLGTIEGLSRSTKNAKVITDLLGISQKELQQRFRENSGQVLTDFIDALRRVDESGGSVNGTLEELGIKAIRDKTVLGSLATNGFNVLTDAIDKTRNAGNALDDEFGTASTKIEKQVGRIKIAWENLVLAFEQGTGIIGKVSVALADVFATTLDGFSGIVASSSFKEFFARMGELSGNPALAAAAKAVGGSYRNDANGIANRPRTALERAVSRSTSGFAEASNEEKLLQIRKQTEAVNARAQEYRARADKENLERLTLQSAILAEMNKLYYSQADLKKKVADIDTLGGGDKDKGKGKTQAEIIKEANEALSKGQVGALNGIDAELLKIDNKYQSIFDKIKKITDLTLRGQLMATAQTNKELEIGRVKLDAWLKTYKKNGFALAGLTTQQLSSPELINRAGATLPLLGRNQERFGIVYGKQATSNLGKQDEQFENRLSKVVERGLRNGFSDVFNSIGDLGTNFYEVFSGVFGKLANTVTSTFGQVISTQLGNLLNKKIETGELNIGGLGSNVSKGIVAGGGLLGGILSSQGVKKSNSGLIIAGGALSGAAAGTAIFPGLGTAVGAVVGAIAGIFQSAGAKKQEKLQEAQLAETRRQTALQERVAALTFTSSIIGQQTSSGIVGSVERNEFGQLIANIKGSDIQLVLDRNKDKR